MCAVFEKVCEAAGLSVSECFLLNEMVCANDKCLACDVAITECVAQGGVCEPLAEFCDVSLTGCGCPEQAAAVSSRFPIQGCAPDEDMCEQLGGACLDAGMQPETCEALSATVCPGARAMSCTAAEKLCEDEGADCGAVDKLCADQLAGCPAPKCIESGELTEAEAIATCFAYPWALDSCDEEPSAGHCMSLLMWNRCSVTTCEWIECQEDLALQGAVCPAEAPESCAGVLECEFREQNWLPEIDYCTGIDELTKADVAQLCELYPLLTPGSCEETLADLGGCDVDACEWIECAESMEDAPLGTVPAACAKLSDGCSGAQADGPFAPRPITACEMTDAIWDAGSYCKLNPWGRPAVCGGPGPTAEKCEEMIKDFEGCGVTQCEFKACAAALAVARCDEVPAVCEGISTCTNNAHDRDVVLRTCAPALNVCAQIAGACVADGADQQSCVALGAELCPGNQFMACKSAVGMCEMATGSTCHQVEKICDDNFAGCAAPKCLAAGDMSVHQTIAFCLAYPARFEQCGGEPDYEDCIDLMTWSGCGVTTCEWSTCMDDLEALGNQCPVVYPDSCDKVRECQLADNG